MADYTDNALLASIKALNEVVLPAVDPSDPLAGEQLRLVAGFLKFLGARLPYVHDRNRFELEHYLALGVRLAADARLASAQVSQRLDQAIDDAELCCSGPRARSRRCAAPPGRCRRRSAAWRGSSPTPTRRCAGASSRSSWSGSKPWVDMQRAWFVVPGLRAPPRRAASPRRGAASSSAAARCGARLTRRVPSRSTIRHPALGHVDRRARPARSRVDRAGAAAHRRAARGRPHPGRGGHPLLRRGLALRVPQPDRLDRRARQRAVPLDRHARRRDRLASRRAHAADLRPRAHAARCQGMDRDLRAGRLARRSSSRWSGPRPGSPSTRPSSRRRRSASATACASRRSPSASRLMIAIALLQLWRRATRPSGRCGGGRGRRGRGARSTWRRPG